MTAPRTDPRGTGHVFGDPAGGFMALACFANGSLAREEIAHRFGLDWEAFSDAILTRTRPGNGGNLLLPYFVPEITPRLPVPVVVGSDPRALSTAATRMPRSARWWRRRHSACAFSRAGLART